MVSWSMRIINFPGEPGRTIGLGVVRRPIPHLSTCHGQCPEHLYRYIDPASFILAGCRQYQMDIQSMPCSEGPVNSVSTRPDNHLGALISRVPAIESTWSGKHPHFGSRCDGLGDLDAQIQPSVVWQ